METLKKGSKGESVKVLQQLLNKKGFSIKVDGDFGTNTKNAVLAFQSRNLDKLGRPLTVDGEVGELTWWSLNNTKNIVVIPAMDYSKMPDKSFGGSKIGRLALQFAIEEMKAGACEIGGNNSGKYVEKYLKPTGLTPPQFWCASFVSWCYMQASGGDKSKMPFKYSPGARDVLAQFKKKNWTFNLNDGSGLNPEPGDIIVWWRGKVDGWSGHIGLVHHCADGFVYTIEGNRSSKVEGFDYKAVKMEKLLGFGRVE